MATTPACGSTTILDTAITAGPLSSQLIIACPISLLISPFHTLSTRYFCAICGAGMASTAIFNMASLSGAFVLRSSTLSSKYALTTSWNLTPLPSEISAVNPQRSFAEPMATVLPAKLTFHLSLNCGSA